MINKQRIEILERKMQSKLSILIQESMPDVGFGEDDIEHFLDEILEAAQNIFYRKKFPNETEIEWGERQGICN